jgi:translocation and assembly module TamB
MRRLVLAALCAVALAHPLHAQEDDDRGRLIRLIESQLSDGDNRQVRIDGFRGALSSEASLDRLSISDADGEWLILEDARLNWRRRALLSGALEVDALTAERLVIIRPPLPPEGPDLPAPEATPFALPDLPVSINIGEIAIAEVELGEPIIGIPATLSVAGSAQLADGSGSADLRMERLDGAAGTFVLDAGFDNATRVLDIDLLLDEGEGGLAAQLLNIPETPALRLSVAGEGPLEDIEVDLGLATDGVERVDGVLRSSVMEGGAGQRIVIDIAGDLQPLVEAQYRPFFGGDSALSARVERPVDGTTRLRELRLATAAVLLEGDVTLDAQNRPGFIDITGRIEPPGGAERILLPVPGGATSLQSADLSVSFDAATDDAFVLSAALDALDVDEFAIGTAQIEAEGRITPSETGIAGVTADLDVDLNGMSHNDPGLSEAIGTTMTFTTSVDWSRDTPLRLGEIALVAGSLSATGDVSAQLEDATLPVEFDLAAEAADLSRFSALSGQRLSGALEAGLSGSIEALSGAFDIRLAGTAQDLRADPAVPAALLAGETRLDLQASRDTEGVRIDALTLDGTQISLDASGDLSSQGGGLSATARLQDLGLFTSAVSGPASITAEIASATEGWTVDATLDGPGGIRAQTDGRVDLAGGRVDLRAVGSLPLALANQFIAPQSVNGQLTFDLGIRGEPGLNAVSGRLSTGGARLVAPTFRVALEDVALDASLSGGRLDFNGGGSVAAGGRIGLGGRIDLGGPGMPGGIDITLDSVRLVDPTLYEVLVARGELAVTGPLAQAPRLGGRINLGPSELRVPEAGLGAAPPIPEIAHVGETAAERRTRAAAGLLASQTDAGGSGAVGLDLEINAPGRIFLRGRGIDAEFGGAIRIAGSSAAIIPAGQFDLIRGRISILGTRLDLTEGSATLQGDFDPFLRLRAESRAGAYRIIIAVDGPASSPDISLSSDPFLPEDEILAQLLFGRSVSALSPVQLLQLADAASSLAGGSTNGGLLSNIREGLGLDDLDLQTDEEGNAAVRAGRYLSDNIYTDVTIGAQGESELSLNIDLTPDITARGSFSSDGNSGLGVFFERDY